MLGQLPGGDVHGTVVTDEDVRVGIPSLIGDEDLYPGQLGDAREYAGRRLDAFGFGALYDVGNLRLYGGLRDRGPDTILVPTPLPETVCVVRVASYPPVAQLVVCRRGRLACGPLGLRAVAVCGGLLAGLIELRPTLEDPVECPLSVVVAVPFLSHEAGLSEKVIHPLGVAIRPEGEQRTQRKVRPRIVAGVVACISPPQAGEFVAVFRLLGKREQVFVADV